MSPLLVVRVLQVLLWGLIVTAPVVAVVALGEVGTLRSRLAAAVTPVEIPIDTALVEGMAELAVADHLTHQNDAGASGWRVAATTSLGAAELAPGYVAVTVAAQLAPTAAATDPDTPATGEGAEAGRRLVFRLGMVETTAGSWAPVAAPSLITPPPLGSVEASVRGRRLVEFPDLSESVTRFMVAYLSGDGDLTRYTAPGTDLTAVWPPPFTTVEITDGTTTGLGDGSHRVAISLVGVDTDGTELAVAYWLVVAEREGRWEITELLAAPPIETLNVTSDGGS